MFKFKNKETRATSIPAGYITAFDLIYRKIFTGRNREEKRYKSVGLQTLFELINSMLFWI